MRLPCSDRNRSDGFALLIVLWMLVLIALIVGYVTSTGRSEIQIARNIATNAAASAAADGAVYRAVFGLTDLQQDQRLPVDGSVTQMRIGRSAVTVRLFDENDRINPNRASVELLEGLLWALGTPRQTAVDLADGITQWVGTARALRPSDALAAEYRAAGFDYAPPETPLESLGELTRVRGMTPSVFAAMRPHLTLFSGREPNPTTPDPIVAMAVHYASQANTAIGTSTPIFSGIGQDARVVRILTSALGPDSAVAHATVIVRINSAEARGYSILSWQDN
jgi:general secretion pathway protein K